MMNREDVFVGGLALVLGLVAALSWWDPLLLPRERPPGLHWVHPTDSFHYYMGPKYFRELGYFSLYECLAAAEIELGAGAAVARRAYRDLGTNQPFAGARLRAPAGSREPALAGSELQGAARDRLDEIGPAQLGAGHAVPHADGDFVDAIPPGRLAWPDGEGQGPPPYGPALFYSNKDLILSFQFN